MMPVIDTEDAIIKIKKNKNKNNPCSHKFRDNWRKCASQETISKPYVRARNWT